MSSHLKDGRGILEVPAGTGITTAGFTGNTTRNDLINTVMVRSQATDVVYDFEVSGRVEPGPRADRNDDVIDHARVEGFLDEQGADDYRFSGRITAFDTDRPVTVLVNGEEVDPEELTESEPRGRLPNTFTIEAQDTDVVYDFEVSGRVEPGPRADRNDDVIDHARVEGFLHDETDTVDDFRFSGRITAFEVDSPATVSINGDEVPLG